MSNSELGQMTDRIRHCLRKLYTDDAVLFERNEGKGVCERCLVFRFAVYLQEEFRVYFVDCDFNSAVENGRDINGKPITNRDGTTTKRFVDIIVHKRTFEPGNDFICFEVKKWNTSGRQNSEKDRNNLRVLTREYGYRYGFYLIFGQSIEQTKWTIFQNGKVIEKDVLVFQEQRA